MHRTHAMVLFGLLSMGALTSCAGSGASAPAPIEDEETLKRWWTAFLQNDPEWPDYRDEWLSRGDDDRGVLLQLLLAQLFHGADVRGSAEFQEPLWRRSQDELRYFGAAIVPHLSEALEMLVDRDRRDPVAIDRVALALGELSDADELRPYLTTDRSEALRTAVAQAASLTRGRDKLRLLRDYSKTDPSWKVRGKLVDGLGAWALDVDVDAGLRFEAQAALIEALDDEDSFVRRRAATPLSRVRTNEVRRALVDRLGREMANNDERTATAMYEALRTNFRRGDLPMHTATWRALLDEGR